MKRTIPKRIELFRATDAIERTLPAVNDLLPQCDAIGGYCLGVMCALGWNDGLVPPPSLLELAITCSSVEQAVELYRAFVALRAYRLHMLQAHGVSVEDVPSVARDPADREPPRSRRERVAGVVAGRNRDRAGRHSDRHLIQLVTGRRRHRVDPGAAE